MCRGKAFSDCGEFRALFLFPDVLAFQAHGRGAVAFFVMDLREAEQDFFCFEFCNCGFRFAVLFHLVCY